MYAYGSLDNVRLRSRLDLPRFLKGAHIEFKKSRRLARFCSLCLSSLSFLTFILIFFPERALYFSFMNLDSCTGPSPFLPFLLFFFFFLSFLFFVFFIFFFLVFSSSAEESLSSEVVMLFLFELELSVRSFFGPSSFGASFFDASFFDASFF